MSRLAEKSAAVLTRDGFFTNLLSTVFEPRWPGKTVEDSRSIIEQCNALIEARGDTAILRLAGSILTAYQDLSDEGRISFFRYLVEELELDSQKVAEAAEAFGQDGSADNLAALMTSAEPARQTLFRKLNQSTGATARLVAMRNDLLRDMREHPDFAKIDLDLVHLFNSWFNRGFLVLRRIDWSTPATILETIIAYEAVHQINDWDDLRRRTQPVDRRCYAYFHPRLRDDPLIFVEIALTQGIPQSIHSVLSEDREPDDVEALDTAVFYSISNCQTGLQGISFGESLIKHVVANLSDELPHLKTFVTLSPIPGLRRWAEAEGHLVEPIREAVAEGLDVEDGSSDSLNALAAYYLAKAKRKDGLPRDPVARFHLSNGAQIHDVLAEADLSEKGVQQSYGAMVNYRYDIAKLEKNSDAFANDAKIARSRRVQLLQRQGAAQVAK